MNLTEAIEIYEKCKATNCQSCPLIYTPAYSGGNICDMIDDLNAVLLEVEK